jgi:hypothetical protein
MRDPSLIKTVYTWINPTTSLIFVVASYLHVMQLHYSFLPSPDTPDSLFDMQKRWRYFLDNACHPCVGAMLIFSVSYRTALVHTIMV